MLAETLGFDRRRGWSAPFPALDSKNTLVTVFGAPDYVDAPDPIADLRRAFPSATFVGCSTAGEILGRTIHDGSLAAAVVRFEGTSLGFTSVPIPAGADSRAAGRSLARALARPSLSAVLVFSDGISVNASELLGGIGEEIPGVPVSGGLAADGDQFRRTWVLVSDVPAGGHVTAVGLYGDRLRVAHGSRGGWDSFGPERVVTRASGNVVYELDHRPALTLYRQYLGDQAAGLPASGLHFPLSVRASQRDEPVVRAILGIDEAESSITFAGDVPQGGLAQLMRANFDRLIGGAGSAAQLAAIDPASRGDNLAIVVSCVGRRLVLGERAEEEVEAAAQTLGSTRLVGFYSYGEISPLASGRCGLHNQTLTLTRLWES